MEIKDIDPALAEALAKQRAILEEQSNLSGAEGAFGRLALRYGEVFQNALTGETLRRTEPEDIMDAVGRLAGYQMTSAAVQFLHIVPQEQQERALIFMVRAMMSAAADYSEGMIRSYLADEAPVVNFTIHESGPIEVTHRGGAKANG